MTDQEQPGAQNQPNQQSPDRDQRQAQAGQQGGQEQRTFRPEDENQADPSGQDPGVRRESDDIERGNDAGDAGVR